MKKGQITLIAAGLLTGTVALAQQGGTPSVDPSLQRAESVLSKSDLRQEDVRKIQSALNEAGYNAGPVDGIWGNRTGQALRNFQEAKGLDDTGRLDEQTILALGYSRDDFAIPPTLSESDVRQVQEALNKEGYSVGAVDGVWGAKTEAALKDFQMAKGIEPTGSMNHDSVLALGLSPVDFAAGEFREEEPTP